MYKSINFIFSFVLKDLSSNSIEPNSDMVDIKSMKTLPQPSVETAITNNHLSSHQDGSSVTYQSNLNRDVNAYHTVNESKSNAFAVVAGQLETNRDVSVLFDGGDIIISLSSGINNNDNSDDAALETARTVHQVSQAIDEVCVNYSMMDLSVNFALKILVIHHLVLKKDTIVNLSIACFF